MELVKPWRNEAGYMRARLLEASYEAELAAKFLEEGLIRNAAGRAYQAWKALLAALAARARDELAKVYTGMKRLRSGARISEVDWVIAFMPSSRVRPVAQVLASVFGRDVLMYTDVALNLHEYQYNGPDREGVSSRYPSDEYAKEDIERLLKGVEEVKRRVFESPLG